MVIIQNPEIRISQRGDDIQRNAIIKSQPHGSEVAVYGPFLNICQIAIGGHKIRNRI